MQRVVEQPVQERSCRPGLVGGAYLPENLALAGHERVETGGNAKKMQRGGMIRKSIRERRDLVAAQGAKSLQRLFLGALADGVELGAVARREADALPRRGELARQRRRLAGVQRDPLAHLDGRMTVRDADEREPHAK